ncbi:hypothetical protein GCM10011408_18830 [Dyella caseinilytica]|nr:hypothetical protein GCM10011408_18830 [Dyella caseinilytica]
MPGFDERGRPGSIRNRTENHTWTPAFAGVTTYGLTYYNAIGSNSANVAAPSGSSHSGT